MEANDLSRLRIDTEARHVPEHGSRRRWLRWAIAAVCVSVAAAVLVQSGLLVSAREVTATKVSLVFPSKALTLLNASGYVVAQRKAAVSSKATGRLEKLHVEEGCSVKEGQIIAQLENRDLAATLEEAQALVRVAQAALNNAEAELHEATLIYQRNQSLRKSGAVSEQAFDTAEARYRRAVAMERSGRFGVERASAAINVASVNLEQSFIRAPFDGVILTKNADEGEVVAPFGAAVNAKAAVVTMADMRSLMVEVDVAESSLEKVKKGIPVEIRLDAFPHDRFLGKVHMIVPTADRTKATVMTKITFDELDPRILPEMSAKAAFLSRPLTPEENRPFLGIPVSAVRQTADKKIALRVNDTKAHESLLTLGTRWGDFAEVLGGLKEGDVIIVAPDHRIKDGTRVKVKE